jgi:ribonucleoside-diphosphate reductase alpha chain
MPTPASASTQAPIRTANDSEIVETMLGQIPELAKLKQVKLRDGSVAPFDAVELERSLSEALKECGIRDAHQLVRMLEQVVGRLEREFDGHTVPTVDDVAGMVAMVAIDNNLPFVAKRYLQKRVVSGQPRRFRKLGTGLKFGRYFTNPALDPMEDVVWEKRDAVITNEKGKVVFEQKGIEVPRTWSQTATNIVVSKYFRGKIGTPEREYSVRQMVGRVSKTIAEWGRKGGYFATPEDAATYEAELTHILLQQKAAFNSPVWFNVGVVEKPQCSACFIQSVKDDMRSIMALANSEAMLFKGGSGTGSNLSTLRSSHEHLGGSSGKSSGPVSFMKGFDSFAGVIKSGGKTRRAAKMVVLNIGHPDVREFIWCKAKEEKKAWTLIDAGFDGSINGEAYASVFFQNANNSVRVTDDFMRAVIEDKPWTTKKVTTGDDVETVPAKELMMDMAKAAWECGDPGIQYDTTVNRWHPASVSGRINASNPCVTGDALVATTKGYRRIADLVGSSAEIINADGLPSLVTDIFPTGRKRVYELRTKGGYALRLTADHRVWTKNRGDVPAAELRTDDVLELRQPGFGTATLDETIAEAVGLAVGDGCLTGEQEIVFISGSHQEAGMLAAFNERLNRYKFSHAADGRGERWSSVVATPTTSRVGTSHRAVVGPLKKYAILDRGSHMKAFQDEIFSLDKASQAAALRGLFSADGTVAHYGEKSQYVALDSTSLTLLRQVQLLLLAFGIKAKIYENRRAAAQTDALMPDGVGGMRHYPVRQIHSLRISRASRLRFADEIGFLPGSPKGAALARLNREVKTYREMMTDAFASLTELGVEDVYDLTEPTTHHFVANGLVVHNCSEYMFLDDTACNLASLNLMKFRSADGEFDVESFKKAVDVIITAQEIVVDFSSYPTPAIEENSFAFRPLGIGYANLGALLMSRGLAYDSDEGRNFAGAITSLLSGEAYYQSSVVAREMGPFREYKKNEAPFLKVIGMHRDASYQVPSSGVPADLLHASREAWDRALLSGRDHGYKNAQISVLAPTGTIGFLMDCDTTGVEPDIALVKYKWLVGGGLIKIVNQTVPEALDRLGYSEAQREEILAHIDVNDTIENAPHLKDEHLPVFDCAFQAAKGKRSIHYMGHIKMMAAVQPFISGAISKTVNMPNDVTPEEIADVYLEGWKLGLKAIAIYRDGCKRSQPLTTSRETDQSKKVEVKSQESSVRSPAPEVPKTEYKALRRRLSDERKSLTHKFSVANHEGYLTVGLYEDDAPGELFIRMSKGGSVINGLMDAFATSISVGLQYGVPLKVLVNKFVHVRFEPNGYTSNPKIRIAKSIVDYIFRWMASKFMPAEEQLAVGLNIEKTTLADQGDAEVKASEFKSNPVEQVVTTQMKLGEAQPALNANALTATFNTTSDAPACETCGSIMVRSAACYKCMNCGSTSGCS